MTEKIEWYKEVLALEPNSKIFFPLARMLEREGDLEQACEVLKEGVARHGEYLEARLFLVELLERLGRTEECAAEVEVLAGLLARYEGFWSAWSASAGQAGADPALFVRMLGLSLKRPGLTLAELLRRGLDSFGEGPAGQTKTEILVGKAPASKASVPETSGPEAAGPASGPEAAGPEAAGKAASEPAQPASAKAELAKADPGKPESAKSESARPEARAAKPAAESRPEPAKVATKAGTASRRSAQPAKAGGASLRTRSMAEVLAEQGDLASAAEIYDELVLAAPEGERDALCRRRDELKALQAAQAQASGKAPAAERADGAARPASKLVTLLENLAARVEARANS
ncbi:MAG: hypothetical protein K6C33_05170 [Desulfovibrio sp.]|nr:hypothetical protein [Desulfovibrio sp.]